MPQALRHPRPAAAGDASLPCAMWGRAVADPRLAVSAGVDLMMTMTRKRRVRIPKLSLQEVASAVASLSKDRPDGALSLAAMS